MLYSFTGSSVTDTDDRVLFIYTTPNDKAMGMELLNLRDIEFDDFNSSQLLAESSHINITKYNSIWIIHSRATLVSGLTITQDWLNSGGGLFVLSDYPLSLDYQLQSILGIEQVYPFHYPLDDHFGQFVINPQIPQDFLTENVTNEPIEYSGGAALVHMNAEMETLATVSLPILDNEIVSEKDVSGIFLNSVNHQRIIYGSFSSYNTEIPLEGNSSTVKGNTLNINGNFKVQSMQQDIFPAGVLDFFSMFTEYSLLGGSPGPSNGNGFNLPFGDPDLSILAPIIAILSIFSALLVFLTGRGRALIFALFAGLLGFIAHIAYTPVRRRLTRTELLKNNTRSNILSFIESRNTRGAHLREIQRYVGCGVSSLLWHLQTLEDFDLIDRMKIGRYTLYFSTEIDFEEDNFSAILRTEMAKKIFTYLVNNKKAQPLSSIAKDASCHPETARYHLNKLEELEAVIKTKDGKRILYSITPKRRHQYLNSHIVA